MCGRYLDKASPEDIEDEFGVESYEGADFKPNYNVAPMQKVRVIVEHEGHRELKMMQWSLIPYWSKERKLKYPTFNARGETIAEKSSFRKPFERSRCIVVNNGFYEWKKIGNEKEPYLIFPKDKKVAGFAGLWDTWKDPESGEKLESFTVITTEANPLVAPIHDRMPVYLDSKDYAEWLDPENRDTRGLQRLIRPYDPELLGLYKVGKDVGSVKNNSPDLIKPLE